jgi:hypothetical protein
MAAGTAGQVESLAGLERVHDFGDEGNRERRFVAGFLAVALVPILKLHIPMIA